MILLVDNYDSFTYNLARYIGKFDEVGVRNDDAILKTLEADALVLFAWSRLAKARARWSEMIQIAGSKPILGSALGHQDW